MAKAKFNAKIKIARACKSKINLTLAAKFIF